jgi:uncharacterized membrane protein
MSDPNRTAGTGIQQNVAGLLCYLAGWITGIIFLILENKNEYVRFHAIQSIAVYAPITVALFVLDFIPKVGGILTWLVWALAFILWVVLMVKAYQGERFKIPIAGDIAEKQSKLNIQK